MLIPVAKKQTQQKYIFTEYEKLALQLLPEEQVKSSNHDEHIIDLMLEDEARDASPEHTRRDIYKALDNRDYTRLLAAAKNLTIQEKNKIVEGLYSYIAQKKSKSDYTQEDAKRLDILSQGNVDLFDLCIQLRGDK